MGLLLLLLLLLARRDGSPTGGSPRAMARLGAEGLVVVPTTMGVIRRRRCRRAYPADPGVAGSSSS
jgi:hypothetical protein